MTRVSENSSTAALKYALNRTKSKMEDLQLKGSTLKGISKPSDNPVGNVEAMSITSSNNDNVQYLKNSEFALLNLNVTEKSLEELTDIITKAKEIAIAQSSDFFNGEIRKNVANEVQQLYNQALAISNKKVGIKHVFSGTRTLTVPFDGNGNYKGDQGHISLEVARDFFVPINLTGDEIFYNSDDLDDSHNPIEDINIPGKEPPQINRNLASSNELTNEENSFKSRDNIFSQLSGLTSALTNDDPKMIQGLLEKFDSSISRLVTLRTRVGSIASSVLTARSVIEKENIDHAARKSSLVDADVVDLFSDINKQQAILKTTYQSSQNMMNQTLMDFLRR